MWGRKHYWTATIMFRQQNENRFARWLAVSEGRLFPYAEVMAAYSQKYNTKGILTFAVEISKKDYDTAWEWLMTKYNGKAGADTETEGNLQ